MLIIQEIQIHRHVVKKFLEPLIAGPTVTRIDNNLYDRLHSTSVDLDIIWAIEKEYGLYVDVVKNTRHIKVIIYLEP